MANFFHSNLLGSHSNAISQIVVAAFEYAMRMSSEEAKRKSFVKQTATCHKFEEMKSKDFPKFLAALAYYDHLWELFDSADDNVDDDR